MSDQGYSPEGKDEAVRQMVDRGYSVAEVAASNRLSGYNSGYDKLRLSPDLLVSDRIESF